MVEAGWCWSLRRDIPSSVNAGHKVIEELLKACGDAGWAGSELFHVQMAAEEAMVNAVKHGNREADDKFVEVEFKVSREQIMLRFKDEGEGFCPETLPDPRDDDHLTLTNGRGVLLIKEMMTRVSYNAVGNEVVMFKKRGDFQPSQPLDSP